VRDYLLFHVIDILDFWRTEVDDEESHVLRGLQESRLKIRTAARPLYDRVPHPITLISWNLMERKA